MPRSPKGRAAARGLDARLSLQHAFMPAGDASPKQLRSIKNHLDSDHGIYREHVQDVCSMSVLHPIATESPHRGKRRNGPIADIGQEGAVAW